MRKKHLSFKFSNSLTYKEELVLRLGCNGSRMQNITVDICLLLKLCRVMYVVCRILLHNLWLFLTSGMVIELLDITRAHDSIVLQLRLSPNFDSISSIYTYVHTSCNCSACYINVCLINYLCILYNTKVYVTLI